MTAYLNIWKGLQLIATISIQKYCKTPDQLIYDVQYDRLPTIPNPEHQNQPESPTRQPSLVEMHNAEHALQAIRHLLSVSNPTLSKYTATRLRKMFTDTDDDDKPTAVG